MIIRLPIEGMHCSSCAMNIDFDLEDIDGVISAKTNYASEICEVDYNEQKVSLETIIQSIQKTGYTVKREAAQ